MRKNRPSRRSRRNVFSRLFGGGSSSLRRAPRRRDVERLEVRQVLSADVAGNLYFDAQWYLDANGQQTEFNPNSPTRLQTLATTDINVIDAWEQLVTGAGVQVGIISGGFDLTHEDLVGAFRTDLARNTLGADGDTNATFVDGTDANGTAIAGIIGARNNDLGVVGIAYEADLVPIRAVPGALDVDTSTEDTRVEALRWRLGLLGDANGDGILDGVDQLVDTDGDGVVDSLPPDQVIDVYFVSGEINDTEGLVSGVANALEEEVRRAIREGAEGGRARWDDLDGDGLFDLDEVTALGAIYVVPAGDDNGTSFNIAFDDQGLYASSQYDELANSRYTIAVGAVPYDGRYEDNAVGTVTSFSEMGSHVLLVAPSSTNDVVQIATPGEDDLNSGIVTTDISGDLGQNAPPTQFPVVNETDGDFFPDTDYTSTYGGTEAAAAQVTAVVAQMLEANPNLSRRDVEMILLMSAAQNDQFSETWVTNAFTYYEDSYVIPQYAYYDLDTNFDGDADVENAVLPNTRILSDTFDPDVIRAYFLNNPDLTLPIFPFNDVTGQFQVLGPPVDILPDPFYIFGVDAVDTETPFGVLDVFAPASYDEVPLLFENGVGFTVSHGFGQYLEEIGYAHGLLDAGLAVELATAWDTYGLTKGNSVTVSTPVDDPQLSTFQVQAAASATIVNDGEFANLVVPGGIGQVSGADLEPINDEYYAQWGTPLSVEVVTNEAGDEIGEVITGGPWYNPDGDLDGLTNNRASSYVPFTIDAGVDTDFLSVEWIEVRSAAAGGDLDHLRISVLSPSGTQSELIPYRREPGGDGGVGGVPQLGQFQQGSPIAGNNEIIDDGTYVNTFQDINDGTEEFFIGGVALPDQLPAGTPYTWTTNRHYGELFSVAANDFDIDLVGEDPDRWYLVFENYGNGAVDLEGLQITVHGTEATGQRIQGKVGVDDNKQNIDFFNVPTQPGGGTTTSPTPEQLGDGVFNFDRYVEFGELIVDPTPTFDVNGLYVPSAAAETVTVVLDDESDAVDFDRLGLGLDPNLFNGRAYRTVDPDTGIESIVPIVSREAYFDYDTNPAALGELVSNLTEFDSDRFGSVYVNPALRETDNAILGDLGGTISSYQNFDYSQESFATGVLVEAVQYRVTYDENGVASPREATGEVQRFVTGADGNYYFDVEATVAPPDPFDDPVSYNDWFEDVGFTLEYEVSVVGQEERLFDREYTLDQQEDPSSQVSYVGGGTYSMQVFASPDVKSGQTTTVRDLNFLLAVDLAEVQVNVTGTVVRDIDGDGQLDGADGRYGGVTVYHDANNNNSLDPSETTAVTAADGTYSLSFDPDGSTAASIRLDPTTYPEPLRPVTPVDTLGAAELQLTGFDPGDNVTGDFFLKPTAAVVTGTVWQDTDQDGVFDPSETPFDGTAIGRDGVNPALFVFEDVNNDGVFNGGDRAASVDASGNYQLEFEQAGTAVFRLDLTNADVSQTFPSGGSAQIVSLVVDSLGDISLADPTMPPNFGVRDQRVFDYGDLPDSYGTLLGSDGARHRVGSGGLYLGTTPPDLELDARPSPNADGDDNDGANDEDGVVLVGSQANATTGVIERLDLSVTVVGGGGVLTAFVDFNNNGVFDANERFVTNAADLATGPTSPNLISINAPAGTVLADRYAARFRYGPFALDPTGEANAGEVEDHWLIPSAVSVSGRILQDADNNGVFNDATDTPVQGARVFLDANLNGVRDLSEPSAVTDADGRYGFQTIAPPDGQAVPITIRVVASSLPGGTEFLSPEDGIVSELVSNSPGDEPNNTVTANFLTAPTDRPTQSITGSVVADGDQAFGLNGDEPGQPGVTVRLLADIEGDPALEVVATTLTDAAGAYSFDVPNTGDYEIEAIAPAGTVLTQTTPNPDDDSGRITVTVGIDDDLVVAPFGFFDRRSTFTRDYGDHAPSYSLDGTSPPSHLVAGPGSANPVYLGSLVDADDPESLESLQSLPATADDLDFTDDEDGVRLADFVLPIDQGGGVITPGSIALDVTATGTPDSRLNVWYDIDGSGVFEPDEHLVMDLAISSGETTRVVRTTTDPALAGRDTLAVRVRWGTPGVGPVGSAGLNGADAVGEVEDHRFSTALQVPSMALAGDPAGVPPLMQMPIEETELEPASFVASAFGSVAPVDARLAVARDESFAIESEPLVESGDAIDDALLLWAAAGAGEESSDPIDVHLADGEEAEEAEQEEDALAAAFAV